ncbi:14117_t:CDS:2, partial [Acaulospora morrowiae]
ASKKIPEPPKIQVELLRSKHVSSRHYQRGNILTATYTKICGCGQENFKGILEWIPYEEFLDIEYIRIGGFTKVYKATWHRGHIKHLNLLTGVVRSESVK